MKLIFVYNSDGTVPALIKDTVHKLVSPRTYPCNLCRITYPGVTMQRDWQKFTESLPHKVIFLHKDKFQKQYPDNKEVQLPAVFIEDASKLKLLIPHTEINKAKDVNDLIEMVKGFLPK